MKISNLLTSIGGMLFAQLLPLLLIPITTRLFAPDAFGFLAYFAFACILISALCTCRLEHAVVLPAICRQSRLVASSALLVTFIVIIVLCLSSPIINQLFGLQYFYIFIVVECCFLLSIINILTQVNIRNGNFKSIAASRAILGSGIGVFQVFFGILEIDLGLVYGYLLGNLVCAIFLVIKTQGTFKRVNHVEAIAIIRRYNLFLKYSLPGNILNIVSFQLPILLIGVLFNSTFVGLFSMTQKLLSAPVTIIGNAIGEVFRNSASKLIQSKSDVLPVFNRLSSFTISIGVLGFGMLYFVADKAFFIILGSQWEGTANIAIAIVPMFFFRFIVAPVNSMVILKEKQHIDLLLHSFGCIFTLLSFGVGFYLKSFQVALYLYSSTFSILYLIVFIKCRKLAKSQEKGV